MKNAVALLTALTLANIPAAGLVAQSVDTVNVRSVVADLRRTGSGSAAAAFLSQDRRNRSAQELDALADSLVAIATAYRHGDPAVAQAATNAAIGALVGSSSPGIIAERAQRLARGGESRTPIPYSRAFDALVRIFYSSPDVRGGTLYAITELPDSARAVAFLGRVAASRMSATTAIRHLTTDMGEPGLAMLRRLYQTDAVIDPTAREDLKAIAFVQGWQRR